MAAAVAAAAAATMAAATHLPAAPRCNRALAKANQAKARGHNML